MNLYLHCLSCLTMSFLLSSKDIRPFLFWKSRQPMAILMDIPNISFCPWTPSCWTIHSTRHLPYIHT
jgi:hypothetical protein